jgi:pyruvate/2-oxoglutarate dehydrogenase complex dihydrolipoamide acyltransferase (E2) component
MATEIYMPQLGMVQSEGTLIEWLKTEGDQVRKGEPVAIIETDKANYDLEAPSDGTLRQIEVQAGETVPVGKTLAWIEPSDSVSSDG